MNEPQAQADSEPFKSPPQSVYNNTATVQINGEKCKVSWGPDGKSYRAFGSFRGEYLEAKGKDIHAALRMWTSKAQSRARE